MQKQRRLGLPEAIDALLHVADEEQPVLPRKAADDGLLNRAGILIFVDEHIAVLRAERRAHLGQRQRRERVVFEVVKIHHAALALGRRVERVVCLGQLGQPVQRRGRHADIRRRVLQRQRKGRLHIRDGLFERVAPRLHPVGDILVEQIRLFLSPQRRERHTVQRVVQRGIAVRRRCGQIRRELHIHAAGRRVMQRAVFPLAERQRLPRVGAEALQPAPRKIRQQPRGGALFKRLARQAHRLLRARKERPRIGARHHKPMQRERQFAQFLLRIAPVRREESVAAHLVAAIYRVLHCLMAEHAALLLVADAKAGVDGKRLKVLAQQVAAEPVQRGDARAGERHHLFAQRRILPRGLAERLADALAHFARRRVGERDDQHVFNRAALAHELHDALHQHGRLARARRRADDQAVSPVGDGVALLLCPFRHGDFLLRHSRCSSLPL